MITLDGIKEINVCASKEELNKLFSYIERYFSDKKLTNAQLENCRKLSNYIKRNNLILGDIETEKLLENKQINEMFKVLETNGTLIKVGQFYNLSSLLETYCTKNNVELTRDLSDGIYDKFNNDIDIIKIYINEIGEFKNLSQEEEIKLSKLCKEGNKEAQEKLINHNLRLVVSIAKNYRNCGVDYADLIQFGNEGLLVAVEKYDEKKGCRFSTYATYWIRQAITRGIAMTSRSIRVSVGLHEVIVKLRKAMSIHILINNGRIPTDNELSEITGVPLERVKLARECMDMTVSISTPSSSEEGDFTLEDVIPDTKNNMEENADKYFVGKYLEKLYEIASITEREKFVLEARNGFYGRIYTLEEIGQKYNCTREWARQIEDRTIEKLRTAVNVLRTYDIFNTYKREHSNKERKIVFRYNI